MSFSEKSSPFYLAYGLPSQSQVTEQQQGSQSQSNSHSPQQKQQSQPTCSWSEHTPPHEQSPSPFLRDSHALSTTATAAGELFLFGGYVQSSSSASNDLYMISTRDFSAKLLKTSGDVPNSRYGHRAALTSTILLILGGWVTSVTEMRCKKEFGFDDSLYLLNLVSREWSRVVVNGPKPCGRFYQTVTLVGSKLFVFGGRDYDAKRLFNDIWAFDLDFLVSNPRWESYEPTSGDKEPLPRAGHVSVTTGNRIIIFGGGDGEHYFNDTWSFDISTRKWTELQCTGSIPSPRRHHAAVLVDNVMYVFGGRGPGRIKSGDLTALDLSTQRWITFRDIGSSPRGRSGHAMASDGTRIFLLGGLLSADAKANESGLVYVLDTKRITYPDPDPNAVNPGEKATQLARESSAGPTQGQPQQPTFSSSNLDVHAEHGPSPFQKATPGELGHPASLQIPRDRNCVSNDLLSLLPGVNDKRRRVPEEDNDIEGSTEHFAKLVAPGASSNKEVARSELARIADLERRLSESLAAQTERERRIARLADQLAQNSALGEQAEANMVEAKRPAGPEQRELAEVLANLNKLLLSRDEALEQAQQAQQAQSALKKATSCAAEANERSRRELAEVRAKLEARESELAAVRSRLRVTDQDAEDDWAKSKAKANRLQAGTIASLVDLNEDRSLCEDREDMQVMGAELTSLKSVKLDEKSIEEMECRNEG